MCLISFQVLSNRDLFLADISLILNPLLFLPYFTTDDEQEMEE